MSQYVTKFSRPSPLHNCILQVIKTGGGNGLGMKLGYEVAIIDYVNLLTNQLNKGCRQHFCHVN